MNRDEIIAMAREADLIDFRDSDDDPHTAQMVEFLERFATLVSAKEREACACLIESKALRSGSRPLVLAAQDFSQKMAADIRARSSK